MKNAITTTSKRDVRTQDLQNEQRSRQNEEAQSPERAAKRQNVAAQPSER
jgi:hypothetical protein